MSTHAEKQRDTELIIEALEVRWEGADGDEAAELEDLLERWRYAAASPEITLTTGADGVECPDGP